MFLDSQIYVLQHLIFSIFFEILIFFLGVAAHSIWESSYGTFVSEMARRELETKLRKMMKEREQW